MADDLRTALTAVAMHTRGLSSRDRSALAHAAGVLAARPDLARQWRDALIAADPSGVVEALPVPTDEELDAAAARLGYRGREASAPTCATCGGPTVWAEDAWTCRRRGCGDEWYPDHGPAYAPPWQ